MGRTKKADEPTKKPRRRRRARTPEERENELIALSMDLAEEQLRNGTASSAVIAHFLKLGSTREREELNMLRRKSENLEAKTESIRQSGRIEELYNEAMAAMKEYKGIGSDEDL